MNNKGHKLIYLKGAPTWVLYYYGYFNKKRTSIYYHEGIRFKKQLKILKLRAERYFILCHVLQTQKINSIQTPYLGYLEPTV